VMRQEDHPAESEQDEDKESEDEFHKRGGRLVQKLWPARRRST
jgi:hypothetical protein